MLEVMIAALILAVLITSTFAAMQRAFPAIETARNITVAGHIIQTEIERLRLKDWSTVSALSNGSVTVDSSFTSAPAIGNRFTLARSVGSPHADMREITLTATWTSFEGRPLSRSYTTRYARYGMYDFFYNTR